MVCINSKKPDPFGHLIVTDANTAAQVFGWMVAGFGTGDWTGHGITSTIAANDPNGLLALGYANNIDLGASQFAGITGLTGDEILVRFTYYGDTNLDSYVDNDDYFLFINGYLGSTPNWLNGDFNYDGVINSDDFFLFINGYLGTPATPTYAIDGLDQTFTAGEEVTLSPRITNNIPLPAGTVFGWTVKQGNTTIATSNAADFAFTPPTQGTYNFALTKTDAGGTSTVATSVADVDTPAGWTMAYDAYFPGGELDNTIFHGIGTAYNGVTANMGEGITGSVGALLSMPLYGNKTLTMKVDNLPKHGWINAGAAAMFFNIYAPGSQYTVRVDGELVAQVSMHDYLDVFYKTWIPHTSSSVTITLEVTGLNSTDEWWNGGIGVSTFLPTVSLSGGGNVDEGGSTTITATRDNPLESIWSSLTTEEKEELLPAIDVPIHWEGTGLDLMSLDELPDHIQIAAGETSGTAELSIPGESLSLLYDAPASTPDLQLIAVPQAIPNTKVTGAVVYNLKAKPAGKQAAVKSFTIGAGIIVQAGVAQPYEFDSPGAKQSGSTNKIAEKIKKVLIDQAKSMLDGAFFTSWKNMCVGASNIYIKSISTEFIVTGTVIIKDGQNWSEKEVTVKLTQDSISSPVDLPGGWNCTNPDDIPKIIKAAQDVVAETLARNPASILAEIKAALVNKALED